MRDCENCTHKKSKDGLSFCESWECNFEKKTDDLISRAEAIDQLHQSINLLEAEERIKELPSANQWIPCSERLPSDTDEYLITRRIFGWNGTEYIGLYIAEYDETDWYYEDKCIGSEVIAWMPLPTPYKGE